MPAKSKFVELEHPDYKELIRRWWFLLLAYEGGHRYINYRYDPFKQDKTDILARNDRHLHRFSRENEDDYNDRVRRSFYLNYCRPIIHIYKSHITRKGVERTPPADEEGFNQLADNIDGLGTPIDRFMMNKVFPATQIYGWCPVLVDTPNRDQEPATEAQRREDGINPFAVIIPPQEFVDWQVGEDGKFDWVKIRERNIVPVEDPRKKQEAQVKEVFKVWTREGWTLFDDKGRPEMEREHGMGEVPIVIFMNEVSQLYSWPIGLSAINDIADLNREIYNMSSLEQEFLYKQCFPVLMLDEQLIGKIIELGQSNGIPVTKEMFKPEYLSPPVEPAKFIEGVIDRLRQEIYRQAIVRDTTAEVGQAESGISKAFDFHDANQNIAQKSKHMEEGEVRVWDYIYRWLGQEVPEGLGIRWPQEFDIKTLNEDIADAVEIYKSDIGSRTLNQVIAKSLVPKIVADDGIIAQIEEELEAGDPGLNIEDKLKYVDKGALSVIDLMRAIFPGLSDEELEKKFQDNLEKNKSLMRALTGPSNGQAPPDTRDRIRTRLQERGIQIQEGTQEPEQEAA